MPRSEASKPYHHGDLHAALLASAEAILERDGMAGLTLRAAAREAGVSHAAPAHHFGDRRGLLSDLAAVGFNRFADHLAAARDGASERPLRAIGLAYVDFAQRWPSLFLLMFRAEGLDCDRPALAEAQRRSGEVLANATRAPAPKADVTQETAHAGAIAAWAIVHGLAMLLLDGRLPPAAGTPAMVDAVLSYLDPGVA